MLRVGSESAVIWHARVAQAEQRLAARLRGASGCQRADRLSPAACSSASKLLVSQHRGAWRSSRNRSLPKMDPRSCSDCVAAGRAWCAYRSMCVDTVAAASAFCWGGPRTNLPRAWRIGSCPTDEYMFGSCSNDTVNINSSGVSMWFASGAVTENRLLS